MGEIPIFNNPDAEQNNDTLMWRRTRQKSKYDRLISILDQCHFEVWTVFLGV